MKHINYNPSNGRILGHLQSMPPTPLPPNVMEVADDVMESTHKIVDDAAVLMDVTAYTITGTNPYTVESTVEVILEIEDSDGADSASTVLEPSISWTFAIVDDDTYTLRFRASMQAVATQTLVVSNGDTVDISGVDHVLGKVAEEASRRETQLQQVVTDMLELRDNPPPNLNSTKQAVSDLASNILVIMGERT